MQLVIKPPRDKIVLLNLQILRSIYRKRPAPLRYWLKFRGLLRRVYAPRNVLCQPDAVVRSTGDRLEDPVLRDLLAGDVLGEWSLDRESIDFLWQALHEQCPKHIMECGAGISTLMFAKYAEWYHKTFHDPPLVLSIDQDLSIKEKLEKRLSASHLSHYVRIIHAPLSDGHAYELNVDTLHDLLHAASIDWLLIDGPYGPPGVRVSTLPLVAPFCRPGARWFLDDAFRDGEVRALRAWARLPSVVGDGIYPFGKGLATGVVTEPQRVSMP